MIMNNNNNNEQAVVNNVNLYQHKPVKIFKSDKGYDRVRDRKDKRLYEYEEENESETDQKSQSLF